MFLIFGMHLTGVELLKQFKSSKITAYVSIQLTYNNFRTLYLTNYLNKNKALNNLSHYVAIMLTETMGEIDESKAGAKIR